VVLVVDVSWMERSTWVLVVDCRVGTVDVVLVVDVVWSERSTWC